MNNVTFYDVKKRAKVDVPASQCWKTKYERTAKDGSAQVRYAVKADYQGSKLTKFVSKDTWDGMSCPEK
jgi:predicted carbohydrate-binding protein with CBM5 and CBM33 domain